MACSKTYPETCWKTCSESSPETYSTSCSETSEICPKPCSFTFPETCRKTCSETSSDSCLKTCPETCSTQSYPETCYESCPKHCYSTCPEICPKPSSFTCPKTCLKTFSESSSITCPETCSNTCTAPCSFTCPETCLKTCSETCPKPCSFTCPETCLKTCSETCSKPSSFTCPETCIKTSSDICSKPCSFTCPETCPKSFSITCPQTCSETCLKTCSDTCPKPCSFTCPDTYLKTCSETCSETCPKPCSFTCPESCLKTYSETCSDTLSKSCSFNNPKPCPDNCLKTCSETCSTTCSETCSKPCSFTFPDTCPKTCPEPCTSSCPETSSETCPKPCPISNPKSCFSTFSNSCSVSSVTVPRHCRTVTTKAHSVYGCGVGGRTRISSCSYRPNTCSPCPLYKLDGFGERFGARIMAGGCYGRDYDYHQLNEKATMQNLNDRLASYLDKVHFLEAANATLEKQICDYFEKKDPICQKDYSCYLKTIDCLQKKIKDATITNGKILLRIDNSKLAADDFRIKYENELSIHQCVKADIDNLRCILDKTCLAKADLELQICTLEEELVYLRKTHQEDVAALMCQLTNSKVCVEVDAAPQQDLKKVLDDIRCYYDTIIDKHCTEQECWFKEKMAGLCKDTAINTECLETSMSRISDLRRTLQSLEIELQSQISLKGALECSLLETEARYSTMLAGYQKHINAYEAELCQVRAGIEQQGRDYDALLDIKSRLEQEIATYRCLLENQASQC
ncbi:keratin, type I cuticular Ha5-like [Danio rerio]|uniref:Keratin, type I cuticular Ha5-like n=1 Tax=Danio rerio TaxID=7955 RepID=A0A8M9Q3N5_DANRE|nr:keratin, type I cytoskeletal 17-like isoform X2 [Danio rerio]|eukprot:XP_021328100.1 keratin, type I cytoskeletal 17-like isoform X2 [Danio rerio]